MQLYTTKKAAEFLYKKLGESFSYWFNYLVNNRNKNRNPAFRLSFDKMAGDIVYQEEELLHFIEWETYRRSGSIGLSRYTFIYKRIFDLNQSSKRQSRPFSGFLQVEKDLYTNKPFISFNLNNPIQAYKLTLEEAESLKSQLTNAIHNLKSM